MFSEEILLFNTRWKCLNAEKRDDVDYTTYAGRMNRECEIFKLDKLTSDTFKCLIFAQRLTAKKDAEVMMKILANLKVNQDITIQKLSEECDMVLKVRHDTEESQRRDCLQMKSVRMSRKTDKMCHKKHDIYQEVNLCVVCGGRHLRKECPFKNAKCLRCGNTGHIKSHCTTKMTKN
ncbi:uncharacterized protein LOC115221276 [Octopus sinensis]|uniref:Uncharacterized protein LOC115221276 n=1 Tax=Octopus sinensis TaxID=2607531 RepID=A0A6P7T8M0_9MOLL|nr:uncharacterized protein LOC115221276 [Octopus sinensis]